MLRAVAPIAATALSPARDASHHSSFRRALRGSDPRSRVNFQARGVTSTLDARSPIVVVVVVAIIT